MPGKKVDSVKPTRKRIAQRVEKFLLNARHMVRELQINSIVGIYSQGIKDCSEGRED